LRETVYAETRLWGLPSGQVLEADERGKSAAITFVLNEVRRRVMSVGFGNITSQLGKKVAQRVKRHVKDVLDEGHRSGQPRSSQIIWLAPVAAAPRRCPGVTVEELHLLVRE
jgi:hypothetical protein